MLLKRIQSIAVLALLASFGFHSSPAHALRDLRLTIPKHSELTPVQRLNRQGVEAVRRHQYQKAQALFLKAYLYDAADPFTLNNLGYISELQGNLDRAHRFYALAAKQDCSAVIALSNAKHLEGEPMTAALTGLKNLPMRINRMNVQAIELLSQKRNFEAEALLHRTLALDPGNPFTLNNLGVAEEATDDLDAALKYYDEAAATHSSEPVVIALTRSWRGKPVSEMASDSAHRLRTRMQNTGTEEARSTMLTFRGVSAINRNDWSIAKRDFLEAYSLNPHSAFSLNNLGYVAEKNGDMETAQFYYSKARLAANADARVGLATNRSAQGSTLGAVAGENHVKIGSEIDLYRQAAHQQTGPVQLIRRDNGPAKSSAAPQKPETPATAPPIPK